MLPFLKNRDDVAIAGEDEPKKRTPDDYGTLDAVAADLCSALGVPDGKHAQVKAALSALCDYIKEEDIEQDNQTMKGDGDDD
jgi:hypothetical protein